MTTVAAASRVDELERVVPEWQALAEDAEEPNAFYEPLVLLPALEQLAPAGAVRVLFVRSAEGQLVGVVPLERHHGSLALPAPHFRTWRHRYCFLASPLVRKGFGDTVVAGLYAWLDTAGVAGRFLRLRGHVEGGAFDQALQAAARRHGHLLRATGRTERPFLTTGRPPAQYFEAIVPAKRRSELRRKRRRLGDTGPVELVWADTPAELERWLPHFLELEDRGWKGAAGTSMAANAKDRAFLRAVVRRSGPRHQVELVALTLRGAPIAISLHLRTGGAVFAFKIAYDEAFGACSPGVLVEFELLQRLLADPATAWIDSCAAPDGGASGSLWAERRPIWQGDLVRASRLGRGLVALGEPLQDLASATRAWVQGLPPEMQRPLRQLGTVIRG